MTRSPSPSTLVPLLAVLALPTIGYAATIGDELSDLREAITYGKVSGTARYRYEYVDQDGPAAIVNKANASTLRAALGYESKSYHGFSGFMQFEGVFALNGEDHYRNAENNKTTYPLVADTPTVEMNQAYGQYICHRIRGRPPCVGGVRRSIWATSVLLARLPGVRTFKPLTVVASP
ncbi:MAG TPA: hypothetical protein VHX44_04335, partial [Planctomycetota bacterium]|nr:hypothetical protein [Planctomycetota bacterium]